MEKAFITENAIARKKLVSLIGRLSESDLERDVGEGWDVRVILAHLAFWDQRTIELLKRWKKSGVDLSPVDQDVLNDALLPMCKAIAPRVAVELALAKAQEVDDQIETLGDGLIQDIEALGDKMRLRRYLHRQMHMDQITAILGSD